MTRVSKFANMGRSPSGDGMPVRRVELPITTCGDPSKPVALLVVPATEYNKPLLAEVLKRAAKNRKTAARIGGTHKPEDMSPEQQMLLDDQGRAADRELYPQFVIRGWENVFGDDRQAVPYTPQDCADFLASPLLEDWVFDRLRRFCMSMENFAVGVGAEDTAKN